MRQSAARKNKNAVNKEGGKIIKKCKILDKTLIVQLIINIKENYRVTVFHYAKRYFAQFISRNGLCEWKWRKLETKSVNDS